MQGPLAIKIDASLPDIEYRMWARKILLVCFWVLPCSVKVSNSTAKLYFVYGGTVFDSTCTLSEHSFKMLLVYNSDMPIPILPYAWHYHWKMYAKSNILFSYRIYDFRLSCPRRSISCKALCLVLYHACLLKDRRVWNVSPSWRLCFSKHNLFVYFEYWASIFKACLFVIV